MSLILSENLVLWYTKSYYSVFELLSKQIFYIQEVLNGKGGDFIPDWQVTFHVILLFSANGNVAKNKWLWNIKKNFWKTSVLEFFFIKLQVCVVQNTTLL